MATSPDTIVLVHGFWMTPRSWEDWKSRYEARGFRVLTPAYPGLEVEVEALNADPSPLVRLTAQAVVEHLEAVVKEVATPPIIIGHSAGGAFTQVLLDHGLGAAGVALNSAPTEGVRTIPLSQVRSTFPVLRSPANRHKAVPLTFEQFQYAFTNVGFTPEQSRRVYERYAIPASGGILWNGVLANFQPGPQDIWVDYANAGRAPLLFLSGEQDHIMPPSVQRSNAGKYHGEGTVTEHETYPGKAHLMTSQEGWEEIADHALEWALAHARPAQG
ncbi:pimeloyl-ACP methyl ester carboxylesterase [Cellulosimicrobium cellulans]|jgi:pimeloyl-ACP methyl ester carboxylesterase|uniref:Alpha/beta hydrolase n=1 Tax=Cellulosimicrobium cellulans TaxID=1710 RepID=A0A1Y0HTB7_CELCE|nr:alpha/beta hydrolase [Cellulosimicrobium cellulans]ARU51412.1 alpha/beta hydrolase [Cellulosimicrobium cellulans]MBM7817842.1 pimeloyl-ACP methyl ester carboxylesterase [Cellulosimicrobium cellulans]